VKEEGVIQQGAGFNMPVIAALAEQWGRINQNISEIVRETTDDDLNLPVPPRGWPIWAVVAHTMGTRVYWLCGVLKQPGAELTPFDQETVTEGLGWEDHLDTPRSREDLIRAIDSTWQVVAGWLQRWSPDRLKETYPREGRSGRQWHTNPSIFMRLLSHEGYEIGQVAMSLGLRGREVIDIWRDVVGEPPTRPKS
jgi:hypothetical protein